MKKFLINTTLFLLVLLGTYLGVLLLANGYTDPYYLRFTTPPQNCLILGTSRAAQGLRPDALNDILNKEVFNYAFTGAQSPYGAGYLESVRKKLKADTKDGVFILAIDPWSISSLTEDPNDSLNFRELKLEVANTEEVSKNPNLPYLIENLKGRYYKILLNPFSSKMLLHDDGWLEVSVDMDEASITKRTTKKINVYKEIKADYKFSTVRMEALKKTIHLLDEHGKVYLVRLPLHPEMMEIENDYMPDLNDKIKTLLPSAAGFLDLTPENSSFVYTDGTHLHKESAKIVSEKIANWILSLQ